MTESDENAEVETDENGVEITCLSPLQQSAYRCRKELGASKDLPELLQVTKDELQKREECIVDQVRLSISCVVGYLYFRLVVESGWVELDICTINQSRCDHRLGSCAT